MGDETTTGPQSGEPAAAHRPASRWRRLLGGPDPQLVRLREEVDDARDELQCRQGPDDAGVRDEVQRHLDRASTAAARGDTDTGWGQVWRARELLVLGLDPGEVRRRAGELEVEVRRGDKLNAWRTESALRHLQPVLREKDPVDGAEARELLRAALRVRNEAFANEYRGLTILRRHQARLLLIGGVALAAAVVLLLVGGSADPSGASFGSALGGRARPGGAWLMLAAMALGVVGAVTSAAQRSSSLDEHRIPKRLGSNVASWSRIPIGAVAGLLVWLGAHTGVAPAESPAAYLLVGAFGAGFTERLVAPSKDT